MRKLSYAFLLIISSIFLIRNIHAYEVLTNVYQLGNYDSNCLIDVDSSNGIRVMQGIVFFDSNNKKYAVYSGFSSNTTATILTLVDLENCAVVDKNSEKILGHANDITYNNKTHKFYVTAYPRVYNYNTGETEILSGSLNSYQTRYVEEFEIVNNKINYTKLVPTKVAITSGFGSLSDGTDSLKFIVASGSYLYDVSGGTVNGVDAIISNGAINQIAITKPKSYYNEALFKSTDTENGISRIVYQYDPYSSNYDDEIGYNYFVNQGGTYYNNNYYFARAITGANNADNLTTSKRKRASACTYYLNDGTEHTGYDSDSSYIMVYNAKTGSYKYSLYIPNTIMEAHLESISVIDGDLYLGFNNHNVSPKQIVFLKYNNIDIYENMYKENHKISVTGYRKNDKNMIISNINNGHVASFLNNISSVNGKHMLVIGNDKNTKNMKDNVATGNRLRVIFNENVDDLYDVVDYKLSIKGDVISDGLVNNDDMLEIANHIIDGNKISGDLYLLAADYNDDNEIKMNDVMEMLRDVNQ